MSKIPNQPGVIQTPGQWAAACCRGVWSGGETPSHHAFFREEGPLVCGMGDTHSHTHTGILSCLNSLGDINIKSGNQPVFFTRNLFLLLLLDISCWLLTDYRLETIPNELSYIFFPKRCRFTL